MLPHWSISYVWAVNVHLQDSVCWHVSWNMWVFNPLYSITWPLFVPLGKYWVINCSILPTFTCFALPRRLIFNASFYNLNSLPDFSTFPSSPWPLQFTTFFFNFSKCIKGHWFITLYVSCVQRDVPTSVNIAVCSLPKFSFHPSPHSWCSLPFHHHPSTHQCHLSSSDH